MLRNILICFTTLAVAGCNKGALPEYNDRPVVEAYLANGYAPVVKISRQGSVSSSVSYGTDSIPLLQVFITEGSNSHQLVYADSVFTDNTFTIQAGKTYTLKFLYNNKEVSAATTVPASPEGFGQSATSVSLTKIDSNFVPGGVMITMPEPVRLGWLNPDDTYYMLVATNLEETKELVRDTTKFQIPAASFRNEPSITDSTQINPMRLEYFGRYRLVLYHLNDEYAALYISNSNSSTNLTSPSTNISNGFGIFTGISADTLYLQVDKK